MEAASTRGTIYEDVCHRRVFLSDLEKQTLSGSSTRHYYNTPQSELVVPRGFPSLATMRTCWPNTATFRTFEHLNWKQLDFYATKLSYLENQLHKLDKAEDRVMNGTQKNQVPFNKKSFADGHIQDLDLVYVSEVLEAPENMSQDDFTELRERLFAHIDSLWKKYRKLVCWLEKERKFPRVRGDAHDRLFTMAQEIHGLNNEALDHWRAIDEIAYVNIDPVELCIQNIWFSVIPWIKRIVRYFPMKNVLPEHNGSQTYNAVGVHGFRVLHKALVLLLSLSLVLVPAGLLVLGEFENRPSRRATLKPELQPRIATAIIPDDALNMDSRNTIALTHLLDEARIIPIAELCPDLPDPSTKAVGGVVTITWPYNKVKGTFAFNLAEPDFRLRRNKGQVRIEFTGRAAKAVGDSGLGGNDEVLIGLGGAAWELEEADRRRSLPGADLGWRLVFSERLSLKIKRAESNETDIVVIDERPNEHETAPAINPILQPLAITKSPSPPAPLSPIYHTSPATETKTKKFNDNEFASPAFVRRARVSYGALFEGGFDIFQDDGAVEGKGRKRTRFGRDSSSWRYASRSASPESAAASPMSINEQISSPTRDVSSPGKAQMADEGCQTMELDESSSQPIRTAPETQTYRMVSKDAPIDDDAPTNTLMDSAKDRRTQTPPLNEWLSEANPQNTSTLHSNDALLTDPDAPPSHSDQQLSSGYSFAGNPWNMGMVPSFETQQKAPSPLLHEPFASSDFGNITSTNQSIPFGESPIPGKAYPGHGESQEPADDGVIHSTESNPSGIDYPSLEPDEDTRIRPIHDEALTNYPTSYLDGGHMPQHSQIMAEQLPQYPEVAELGSSSWATVNLSSRATAVPPMDHLGSRDGNTPEQALVIDGGEADSDSEPEPMAVEDTVNNGRAYALGMYEDAEAEDEVDAQYSDDDEPEYDADEMGGDYDTRNYEQPGDDDEGSPDESLRPRPLEPEFDDGESWDEEEQEEFLDEEDEGEYETDEDIRKPVPQPAVRANPMVIDLISSSEDEGEVENEDESGGTVAKTEQFDTHTDFRILPSHQQSTQEDDSGQVRSSDEESEIVSQASMSEAEDSSEVSEERHEYMSPHGEEDREYEDENKDDDSENDENRKASGDEMKLGLCKGEEIQEPEFRNQAKQQTEPEINSEAEAEAELRSDAVLDQYNHADISYRQAPIMTELHESIGIETTREISEGGSAVPLSAADGLEMLSRAVDKESIAWHHNASAESVVEAISDEQESPEENMQLQDSSSYQQKTGFKTAPEELSTQNGEGKQIGLVTSPKPDTESPPPIINKEPTAAIPSSPPLTQSFQSLIEDSNSGTFKEITATSEAQLAATQLPTPLNTQVTDITFNTSITTSMNIAESFESHTTIEQQDYQPRKDSIAEKLIENFAQQDSNMNICQDSLEQEDDSALIVDVQAQPPSRKSSPARSFQTQVDDAELALPGTVEETKTDGQPPQRLSSENRASASDISRYFASHMEVDEELQASILEDSQLRGYSDQDSQDEDDEPFQIDPGVGYAEPEEAGQAKSESSLYENTPAKQLAEDISAQLKRNFIATSSGEESDTSTRNDPSVHLARVANASRKTKRKRAASTDSYRPRKRLFDTHRSPTPETDNSSIQLARASLASHTPKSEEDSYSMTAAKLQLARHLRDELHDCTSLKVLRQHLTKSLDVIAVAVMQPPEPQRAKGRPREYMMSFTIADHSIGPYAVAEALIYRPHKDSLPVVRYGDIVLLRNFTAVSLANKGFGLKSNDRSSWAIFDYEGEPPQIRGPPVEYGEKEMLYVTYLREWFRLLDVKAREKLELANQKIIHAGKST
ncbi:hypothetical protein F5Y12DRAFT_720068 [Xylaria sp. FL1777]|nr:hypothetical protein F5Y12DRAFT_720068 [Xylaria sp. FL1777]